VRKSSPDLLLIFVAIVWGGSYLSAKTLVAEVGVEAALTLRYVFAALGMVAIWLVTRSGRPTRRLLLVGVGLGTSQAAILWLETSGVARTSATNAGILISLSLLLTPLIEGFLMHRRLPAAFYFAVTIAVCGIGLLSTGVGGLRPLNPGDLLVLGAALVRAAHVAMTARLLRPGESVFTLVTLQMLVGAALFAAVSLPSISFWLPRLSGTGLAHAVFLGLGCSVFAFVVQAWAVRRTSAARASLLMGTEPLWAALIGVTLGGDALGPLQMLGAAGIIGGAVAGAAIERRARVQARVDPRY